jgi:aminoglycoside phosphotransferase (APT) family kinase protein
LLAAQFPHWADLPIEPVRSAGTDNAIYRLGDDMAVRLPRIHWATGQPDKEHQWLPKLAPLLPLAIPVPLAKGTPAEGYPWHWSVCRWLEGETATLERITDLRQAATDLAQFVAALQRVDPTDGPRAGDHNLRGVPLALRDRPTRAAIAALHGVIDADAVTTTWEAALQAPEWDRAPVWFHGDLLPGNLLVEGGRLSAVIDFGGLGVGDPACDLMIAWGLFSGESRDVFRSAVAVDDATWARGRGHALSQALIFIPYYSDTNPVGVGSARRAIQEVLADHEPPSR